MDIIRIYLYAGHRGKLGRGGKGGKVGHVYGYPEHEGGEGVGGGRGAMHVVLGVHVSPPAGVMAYMQPTKSTSYSVCHRVGSVVPVYLGPDVSGLLPPAERAPPTTDHRSINTAGPSMGKSITVPPRPCVCKVHLGRTHPRVSDRV